MAILPLTIPAVTLTAILTTTMATMIVPVMTCKATAAAIVATALLAHRFFFPSATSGAHAKASVKGGEKRERERKGKHK